MSIFCDFIFFFFRLVDIMYFGLPGEDGYHINELDKEIINQTLKDVLFISYMFDLFKAFETAAF